MCAQAHPGPTPHIRTTDADPVPAEVERPPVQPIDVKYVTLRSERLFADYLDRLLLVALFRRTCLLGQTMV